MANLKVALHRIIKKLYINLYKVLFRQFYRVFNSLLRIDNKKFIIATYRSSELEGNLKYIFNQIKNKQPDAKIHLVKAENRMNLRLFKEAFILRNAKYLIIDDYYLPAYLIKPNKELKVIQLWHAAGAFKKFGWSTLGTKFGPDSEYLKLVPIHSNYTNVYVSSGKVVEYYAEAFNMSKKKVFPLGIPRVDLFNNKDERILAESRIYGSYPKLSGKSIVKILVAPTYRADGAQGETPLDITKVYSEVSRLIKNNVYLIFKPHPYMNKNDLNRLSICTNVIIALDYPINEWMLVSDALITDYSSSAFEYALLNRPIAHFVPDLAHYTENRGFYNEISKVSDGAILKYEKQLVRWINNRIPGEYFDTSRMVRYNFDETQNISKNIVDHFIHQQ
ncbi:CDP-glycerol glycerophosphotransferase family protein [Oceanobacillus picturae]|uniref:CDP-glycerol glycerophosphotransferase family protein n=1 Tax=Oceanobacillus picturae TaxID=171693 RepID=UPI0036405936